MTTTTESRSATGETCPAWCTGNHPRLEPDTHVGADWEGYGLYVGFCQSPEGIVSIGVDHGPSEGMTLTEAQAHELGMALVRAADRVRRGRRAEGVL